MKKICLLLLFCVPSFSFCNINELASALNNLAFVVSSKRPTLESIITQIQPQLRGYGDVAPHELGKTIQFISIPEKYTELVDEWGKRTNFTGEIRKDPKRERVLVKKSDLEKYGFVFELSANTFFVESAKWVKPKNS